MQRPHRPYVPPPPPRRARANRRTDAEAVQLHFDPAKLTYAALLEFFFRMHDPTTLNRQGPDSGTQYRSAIFTHSAAQEKTAADVKARAAAQWWAGSVSTVINPAGRWYDTEEYHQTYLDKSKRAAHPAARVDADRARRSGRLRVPGTLRAAVPAAGGGVASGAAAEGLRCSGSFCLGLGFCEGFRPVFNRSFPRAMRAFYQHNEWHFIIFDGATWRVPSNPRLHAGRAHA